VLPLRLRGAILEARGGETKRVEASSISCAGFQLGELSILIELVAHE
jgi:hypothetical protein